MQNKDYQKLRSCPFCGGEARIKQDIRYPRPKCAPRKAFEVFCANPKCIIGFVDERYYLSLKKAADAWNRRANDDKR